MAAGADEALRSAGSILSGKKQGPHMNPLVKANLISGLLVKLDFSSWTAMSEKLYIIKGGCGAGRYGKYHVIMQRMPFYREVN